jgi:transcription initiation factor IIF auxiliary subunit
MRRLFIALGAWLLLFAPLVEAQPEQLTSRNTARYLGDGQWEWTVFLEGPDAVLNRVQSVEYALPPTYEPRQRRNSAREDLRGPFAISARGWRTFDIPITVTFQDGSQQSLSHSLSFTLTEVRASEVPVRAANTAERIEGKNLWRWTAFVEAPEDVLRHIQCVEYRLHETFPDPVQEVCERGSDPKEAFSLTETSWDTFPLRIRVYFKDGRVLGLVHTLQF